MLGGLLYSNFYASMETVLNGDGNERFVGIHVKPMRNILPQRRRTRESERRIAQ